MKVRYAPWLAATMTGSGVALTVFGVVLMVGGNGDAGLPVAVPGAVLIMFGALYFGPLPYLIVTDTVIVLPNVLGAHRRVRIGPGDEVRMEGGRIVVGRGRDVRKVPAWRAMAHRGDWESLTRMLRS